MTVGFVLLQGTALLVGLNISLGIMGVAGLQFAGFLQKTMVAFINLMACALFGAISSIVLSLVGKKRMAQWVTARSFYYTMYYSVGIEFEIVQGEEYINSTRPAVLVGNHQSALDISMLAAIWPHYCSVTAKKSLKNMPFLGWFMSLSGAVFLDRANKASALKAFEGAATEMQQHKQSVFIFPEGTRSGTSEPMMLPFKKGAFHLAVQAKAPILPIVTGVYSGVFSTKEKRFRSGKVPVVVLKPIPTEHLTAADVDELTRYTRERMLDAITELYNSPRGQQAALANPPSGPREARFIGRPSEESNAQSVAEGGAETINAAGDSTAKKAGSAELRQR